MYERESVPLYARLRSREAPPIPMPTLLTPRLELVPITLAMVEAVMLGQREQAESVAGARLPAMWPNRALVERAFSVSLDLIRADPAARLWGDRLIVSRGGAGEERRVLGSVVFNGRPEAAGIVEVAYGVEEGSQGLGYGTEATRACVEWALVQDGVAAVQATTAAWHAASLRIIEKLGMVPAGTRDHELFGELLVFQLSRSRPHAL